MRAIRMITTLAAGVALAATAVYAALQVASPPVQPSLAVYAPTGALLALESPDFAALLHSWETSPEQRRWLASDDYAGFSRSRLFGRLGEAQSEFASAAGLQPDTHFLDQIAGTESLFAWYDIGKLEFLYITRLSHEQSTNMPLLALSDKFERRQAGGVDFYVRTSTDEAGDVANAANSDSAVPRTVAFAVRGDLLLLATREDLLVGALQQMAHPGGRSLASDPWYTASVTAAKEKPGDLRLTLNMATVVRSPYFRSYWVQQNITAMGQYSAVLSDLYRDASSFREERYLLPSKTGQPSEDSDLRSLMRLLPAGVVYRAVAHPSAKAVVAELQDKLLARTATNLPNPREAPEVDLNIPHAGDASDLDDRIDSQRAPVESSAAAYKELNSLLEANPAVSMLSFSSAQSFDTHETDSADAEQSGIFRAIHAGVVFSSGTPCDAGAWQHALTTALSTRVSVGYAGLQWQEQTGERIHWSRLDGSFPLVFAAEGNTCVFASDPATLLATMSSAGESPMHASSASMLAGFSHTAQRAPLRELVSALDHTGGQVARMGVDANRPPFFSGNMVSISDTFEDLDSETFAEFHGADNLTRQTVVYTWRRK